MVLRWKEGWGCKADQERVRVEGRPKLGKSVLVANCCETGGRGLGKDGLDGSRRGGC